MKTKIKFRGKDSTTGEWVYGDLLNPITSCRIVNYTELEDETSKQAEYHYYNVNSDTIGMFTGFYDHNGKEIYDGDVLVIADEDKISGYYEVIWCNGAFMVQFYNSDKKACGFKDYLHEYNTTGFTIYEDVYNKSINKHAMVMKKFHQVLKNLDLEDCPTEVYDIFDEMNLIEELEKAFNIEFPDVIKDEFIQSHEQLINYIESKI